MDDVSAKIDNVCKEISTKISIGMRSRGYRAANELRNASQLVLRGQRSGRRYAIPNSGAKRRHRDKVTGRLVRGRRYTASAPGEPPAVRTGAFRASWQPKQKVNVGTYNQVSVTSYIESRQRTDNGKYNLGSILENGSGRMAPRPYKEKIQEKAKPKIVKIYKEPYM